MQTLSRNLNARKSPSMLRLVMLSANNDDNYDKDYEDGDDNNDDDEDHNGDNDDRDDDNHEGDYDNGDDDDDNDNNLQWLTLY